MSSYDLDGCNVYIFFPFQSAGHLSSSLRCLIIFRPGSTICQSIWVIKAQIMTEELIYRVIKMSMNPKSGIFELTECADSRVSKQF